MSFHNTQEITLEQTAQLPFFVYGTLRCGENNYLRLMRGRTVNETPAYMPNVYLLSLGQYPMMLEAPLLQHTASPSGQVRGDLIVAHPRHYEMLLAELDDLEDYLPHAPQHSLYQRVQRQVVDAATGQTVTAWTYLGNPTFVCPTYPLIPCGDWVSHRRSLRSRAN